MCLTIAFCLGMVWLAYSTGFRQGRETSPEFYAFQEKELRADSAFWASLESSASADDEMCRSVLEAIKAAQNLN
jgi:hypothetical protein